MPELRNCDRMSTSSQNVKYPELYLPTAYLPPLEYMLHLVRAETAWIELFETWPKQTWRNRCSILTANGLLDLVVPVSKPLGNSTMTKDVVISDHEPWHKRHWRAISAAYKNAPYFLYYGDLLEPFYAAPPAGKIWLFNKQLLERLLNETGIKTTLRETAVYKKEVACPDLREDMTPKLHRRRHPIATQWPPYYQVFSDKHGFQSNLSILDLLFHLGPDTKAYLEEAASLNRYQLREG